MSPRDAVPIGWTSLLCGGAITLGGDLATTEKATSNPSTLIVNEKWGGLYVERLVLAWKTKDEAVTTAIWEIVINDIIAAGKKIRCGCIDATNETFFAQSLKRRFAGRCAIHLIKGGEKLKHGMQEFDAKTLLGSMYVNAHTDGLIATPEGTWIKDDRRLVKRNKGRFECDLGRQGEHGDTFDGGKLALWGQLRGGGPAQAAACAVGTMARNAVTRALRNPFAKLFRRNTSRNNS